MLAAVGLALVMGVVAVGQPGPAAADAAGLGGDYVPFSAPVVVLDTRDGTGGFTGKVAADTTRAFPVLGVGSIPASGVSAVLLKVATVDPTAGTFLRLWPDGQSDPGITMLTVATGQDMSNALTVAPGPSGKVVVSNSNGSTHIVIVAQGYFRTAVAGTGGGFVPVTQTRVVDTRTGVGTTDAKIPAGGSRTITLTGSLVPAGAAAVAIGLCVPSATAAGYLTVLPAGVSSSRSTLNFEKGTSSSLAAVKLSSAGQVTVTNRSSAAVDLVITMEGYFTASPTTGAGFRLATGRVFDTRQTTAIPANGTVDFQVSGRLGMPTRGVAAVVVNLTAVGPTGNGWLRMWPVGSSEGPATGQAHFNADSNSGSLVIVKPGTDGKVRLRNGGSTAIDVVADVQGYFADPIPVAPVEAYAPTVGVQAAPVAGASLGTVDYAFTDNIGRVLIGHQTDVDNFGSVQWTVVSGNEAFTGRPALTKAGSGKLELAVRYSDSDVWSRGQTAVGAATWTAWADLGGSMAGAPTLAITDGLTSALAVDADGKLWMRTPSGLAPAWRNLGDKNLTGTPVVAATRDGIRIFAVDTDGAVQTATYTAGVLSAWTSLGDVDATGTPTVVVSPGYRMRVFVRTATGVIVTKQQDTTGAFPAEWTTLGAYVSAGSPSAVLDPILGRIAVVTRGPDGQIMLSWETAQGSGIFGDWSPAIPDLFESAATDPTLVPITNTTGQTWLILFRNANNANRIYERQPVSGLAGLTSRIAGGSGFTAHTLPMPPVRDQVREAR